MKFVFVEVSRRAWGTEQHCIALAIGCHLAGHRVVAVVREGSDVATLLAGAGVEIRLAFAGGSSGLRSLIAVARILREVGADWLVTGHSKHYWSMYALARLTGTRIAAFRHLPYLRRWHLRLYARLADRFFVVSDFVVELLAGSGIPRASLLRLYNPIDLQRFRPDPAMRMATREELQLPPDALVAGFAGRHERGKGVQLLREALEQAMAIDPRIHAIWVGAGAEWNDTRAMIANGPHMHRHRFIEWTHSPERYYVAMDCLVAPSLYTEAFGRVVAEAQACEVPVITSTQGGLAEAFLPGDSGCVFEGTNAGVLATTVVTLLQDSSERSRMGETGRRFVQKFDTKNVVREFLEALTRPVSPVEMPAHTERHF